MKRLIILERIFIILALILVPVALYFAFNYAQLEKVMGVVQKIFYFHVGSAWIGFFGFFLTFIFSILFLIKRNFNYDIIASCAAEVGLLFCTMVLLSGPIWGKAAWGTYWTWDARLTSTLILWFIYVSYIILRKFLDDVNRRARFSAIVGIIGFLNVPLVFLSVRLWRTMHPNLMQKGGGLESSMKVAMFISLGTFTCIFLAFLFRRIRVALLEREVIMLEGKRQHDDTIENN